MSKIFGILRPSTVKYSQKQKIMKEKSRHVCVHPQNSFPKTFSFEKKIFLQLFEKNFRQEKNIFRASQFYQILSDFIRFYQIRKSATQ